MTAPRMSIDELEQLLSRDDEVPIEILPNGEVRAARPAFDANGRPVTPKPITFRENLGGEYA